MTALIDSSTPYLDQDGTKFEKHEIADTYGDVENFVGMFKSGKTKHGLIRKEEVKYGIWEAAYRSNKMHGFALRVTSSGKLFLNLYRMNTVVARIRMAVDEEED